MRHRQQEVRLVPQGRSHTVVTVVLVGLIVGYLALAVVIALRWHGVHS